MVRSDYFSLPVIHSTSLVFTTTNKGGRDSVSKPLLIQSTGAAPLDQFLASRIKIARSSTLDQACLYGQGLTANQPLGIINATGTNHVTTASPITWVDLAALRLASTNYHADRTSFGFITNPLGRKTFETSAKFSGGAISIWDTVGNETEAVPVGIRVEQWIHFWLHSPFDHHLCYPIRYGWDAQLSFPSICFWPSH